MKNPILGNKSGFSIAYKGRIQKKWLLDYKTYPLIPDAYYLTPDYVTIILSFFIRSGH